jgi:Flavodoxin
MKALVVYESMYGNTARIAEAIGQGLDEGDIETVVGAVDDVAPEDAAGVDLLVVGGPTHAHGMTREGTRQQALKDGKNTYDDPTRGPGLRSWTEQLPPGGGRLAAAFDTRMRGPKAFTGSAAKGIAQRLQQHGFRSAAEPGSFLVTKQSTLVEGEGERARTWALEIARNAGASLHVG